MARCFLQDFFEKPNWQKNIMKLRAWRCFTRSKKIKGITHYKQGSSRSYESLVNRIRIDLMQPHLYFNLPECTNFCILFGSHGICNLQFINLALKNMHMKLFIVNVTQVRVQSLLIDFVIHLINDHFNKYYPYCSAWFVSRNLKGGKYLENKICVGSATCLGWICAMRFYINK